MRKNDPRRPLARRCRGCGHYTCRCPQRRVARVQAPYKIAALEERQRREGFQFGYLGHSVRKSAMGRSADNIVLVALRLRGYDEDDAYQALNSRSGRHLGDAISGATSVEAIEATVLRELWKTPAEMYADFGEKKEVLAARAPRVGTMTKAPPCADCAITTDKLIRRVDDLLRCAEEREDDGDIKTFKAVLERLETQEAFDDAVSAALDFFEACDDAKAAGIVAGLRRGVRR